MERQRDEKEKRDEIIVAEDLGMKLSHEVYQRKKTGPDESNTKRI